MSASVRRLEIQDVSVARGRSTVLSDVSLVAPRGVTVVAGPNGSGKSTLLRAIATLHPFEGIIELVDDEGSVRSGDELRNQLGFAGPAAMYPSHLSVEEAVTYASWLQRVGRRDRPRLVTEALELLAVDQLKHRKLGSLSTGERRRAELAASIVHRPALLVLDEPTSGIDPEHRAAFRATLTALATERVVIMSSHLPEELELLADAVVVLAHGGVAFHGPTVEFLSLASVVADHELPGEAALRAVVSARP